MNLPGVGAVDLATTIYSYAGVLMWLVLVVGILVALAVVFYKVKKGQWFGKYPVKVFIWEIRAGRPMRTGVDVARAEKDEKGAWIYKLKKKKTTTQPVPFEYINPDGSVDLLALGRDELHPIQLLSDTATIVKTNGVTEQVLIPKLKPIINEGIAVAYAYRMHKNYSRKPTTNFWEKYGSIITIMGLGMVTMLILFVVLREMGAITTNLSSVAAQFAQVSMKLGTCSNVAAVAVAP